MSFTNTAHNFRFLGSAGANVLTFSVPAGKFVVALACGFGATGNGTFADSVGSNVYTQRGGANNANFQGWCEAFECPATAGSTATTVTYTPGTSNTGSFFGVLAFTSTASPNFGSFSNISTTGSLTANSLASASLTCSSSDGIAIGMSWDGNGPATDMTVGTSPTAMTLADILLVAGGHFGITEYGAISGSTPITCTPAEVAPVAFLAVSYFNGSGGGTRKPSLPLTGVGALAPLAWVIRRRQIRAKERNAELRQWNHDDTSGLILPSYKKVA